jgi:hypothetical protein
MRLEMGSAVVAARFRNPSTAITLLEIDCFDQID